MIFDSHLHIVDPRFPLTANQGYLPKPFTCSDYQARAKPLGIVGGAIVSGSFQGFDQGYLLAALQSLGPSFVGVTQLPSAVSDEEILKLDTAGVRAVRFNLKRGGSAEVSDLPTFARRVHELAGWHVELYVDGAKLPALLSTLRSLPKVVIDHLGLTKAGLPALLDLVDHGACVKATGLGRLDFDPAPVIRQIAGINPNALLFGTDLPSTRARRPFEEQDLWLIEETLEPDLARRALCENALALYRPAAAPPASA
ncbi:MAG: amidohydrolase family protein [Chromatiales bacterium]